MTHLEILDLIAGLIFVYFLLSLVCNSVFEAYSSIRRLRAKMLEEWLLKTFKELGADHFKNNTVVDGMSEKGKSSSYIKRDDFAIALIQLISKQTKSDDLNKIKEGIGAVSDTVGKIEEQLYSLPDNLDSIEEMLKSRGSFIPHDIRNTLLGFVAKAKTIATTAKHDIDKINNQGFHAFIENEIKNERFHAFIGYIENWFDNMMERLSGKYKRKSMLGTFIIALVVTLAINADTLTISKYLYSNKEATARLAQAAYDEVEKGNYKEDVKAIVEGATDTMNTDIDNYNAANPEEVTTPIDKVKEEAGEIKEIYSVLGSYIPIGWNCAEFDAFKKDYSSWTVPLFILNKLPGWLLTIFAVMLGAPFWYDLLGKVANLRGSLKPQENNKKKKKEKDNSTP